MVYLILGYNRADNSCMCKASAPNDMKEEINRLIDFGYQEVSEAEFFSVEIKKPVTTDAERIADLEAENKTLKAQVSALTDQNDFQEELIVELAGVVYA